MVGGGEGDGGSVDTVGEGSSGVVDGMVGDRGGVDERSGVVSSVVGDRGSVDEGGCVVNGVVGNWGGVDERSSVVDDGLVGAGNSLVLHVSVVLLVLIDKVVNDLSPAVRQVDHVLALDDGTLADLCAGVLIGVAISVDTMHVVAKLVIMGDLLVGGGVDEGSSMVDGMVGERSGVVDGVVGDRGGVDERGGVVDGVVGNWGGVDEGGSMVDCMVGNGGGVDKGSWDLGHCGCHQGRGNQEQLHL